MRDAVWRHSFTITAKQFVLALLTIFLSESTMSVVAVAYLRMAVRKSRPIWRKCPLTKLYSSNTTSDTSRSPFPFSPSEPPGTNGTPVFPDVDFSIAAQSQDARRRNEDPHAVLVVTGANRGIGLQFVKSLLHRSKVSDVWQ
jgi:hypothetical protein